MYDYPNKAARSGAVGPCVSLNLCMRERACDVLPGQCGILLIMCCWGPSLSLCPMPLSQRVHSLPQELIKRGYDVPLQEAWSPQHLTWFNADHPGHPDASECFRS